MTSILKSILLATFVITLPSVKALADVTSQQVWDGLSKTHQAAINKHTGKKYSMMAANYWGGIDAKQLATAKNMQKGVKFTQLSKKAAAEFDAVTAKSVDAFLAAKEKKGIPARAIYKAATQ